METLDNSEKPLLEHTLVDTKLLTLLDRRLANYLFRVKALVNSEKTWFVFLVDSYGKTRFLDEYNKRGLEFENFGRLGTILVSGAGDLPQEIADISASKLVSNNLIKLVLHKKGYDETYYVLCDPERKLKILEATSVEEIQQHGRILYAALDTEPAEVISFAIIKGIYNGSSPEIDFTIRNRHIEAFWGGDLQTLEEYLSDDANAMAVDHNGWNLLHYCALWGGKFPEKEELIFRLAGRKIDASVSDNWGRLPRHIAAKEGRIEVLNLYMIKGIGVDARDCNGWADVHYVAWKGNSDCFKFLISNHANVFVRGKSLGKSPILVASEEGHTEIVKLILKNWYGEPGMAIFDVDDYRRTPFYYAAQSGQLETALFLIGQNFHVVEAPNIAGATPLHAAVSTADNADMIDLLISHGSKLDSKDNYGRTPLHYAAEHGHLSNVRVLIGRGADVNAVDNEGKTPLDYAKDHELVTSYLTEKIAQNAGWGCSIS